MDLAASFQDAQARVKTLTQAPSNDQLLELYALYKQASAGDVTGSRPGMMDFKGRAKFDAWAAKKGTSKDSAMTAYVALVDRLVK
ncbi:MAG: acyl-CoA-binding protein [Myxococcales bacterium]|jgi:acyl-CoA-binding protein|nr:acyl-CoA-binding protein [Myxococcales bacterium]MBL0194296.1 acyl-CoA-binding protein [Myxococcales bacterium]HQY63631.1 acyl-CoA-binding protein [Polyangiaceae bacterium]